MTEANPSYSSESSSCSVLGKCDGGEPLVLFRVLLVFCVGKCDGGEPLVLFRVLLVFRVGNCDGGGTPLSLLSPPRLLCLVSVTKVNPSFYSESSSSFVFVIVTEANPSFSSEPSSSSVFGKCNGGEPTPSLPNPPRVLCWVSVTEANLSYSFESFSSSVLVSVDKMCFLRTPAVYWPACASVNTLPFLCVSGSG